MEESRMEERRKAIKEIQQYFVDELSFSRSLESSWSGYLTVYVDNCTYWDVPDDIKVFV